MHKTFSVETDIEEGRRILEELEKRSSSNHGGILVAH